LGVQRSTQRAVAILRKEYSSWWQKRLFSTDSSQNSSQQPVWSNYSEY
jgi:hypothetical protein